MKTAFYDVVIIGAGASGCAAAMSLPEGVSALIIDRRSAKHERCCGGLLAPDAQKAFARLRLELPDYLHVHPEPRLVHVRDLDSGLEQTYHRNYRNIDRARFDAWLLELAKKRAEFLHHTRFAGLERKPDGLLMCLMREGRPEYVHTHFVIGADGAHSAVRQAAFPSSAPPHTAVAIQARLTASDLLIAHEVLFSSKHTDFYAWAIPKGNTVLIGSAFSDAHGTRARFEEILRIMREYLGLSGKVIARSARRLTRPCARKDLFSGDNSVLLVGEAAGLVSPSSGEGISFAIESGVAAGVAVAQTSPSKAYSETLSCLARRVAWKMVKARVIFSVPLRRLALRVPWCP